MNEKRLAKIKEVKLWFKEYKKFFRCEKCGENNTVCLDFHHPRPRRNRGQKMTVSRMVCLGKSRQAIKEEIKKCICLCKNCHATVHAQEQGKQLSYRKKSKTEKIILDIKNKGKCEKCGIKGYYLLQFHHLDMNDKKFNIGSKISKRVKLHELFAEIAKTILLCACCHIKEHT